MTKVKAMGILYLIASRICGTFKIVCVKRCGERASGESNSVKINLARSFGCLIVSLVVWLVAGAGGMNDSGIWISLLSGVSNAFFLFSWVLAAQIISVSLVELLCMIGAVVVPVVLGPFLYEGEVVTAFQWAGTALLTLAVFFFFKRGENAKKLGAREIGIIVLCSVSNVGAQLTQKLFTAYGGGGVDVFNLMTYAVLFIVLGGISLIRKFGENRRKMLESGEETPNNATQFTRTVWILIVFATISLYASSFLSTYASTFLPSAVFYPVSYALGMVMTFICDSVIFKEKVTAKRLVGLALVICAIVFNNL